MRISIYKHDPGFVSDPSLYVVYINGKMNMNCVTADEEQGTAIVYSVDINGKQLIKDKCLVTKVIQGDIKIGKIQA